jgi:Zn-finger protein
MIFRGEYDQMRICYGPYYLMMLCDDGEKKNQIWSNCFSSHRLYRKMDREMENIQTMEKNLSNKR